VRMIRSCVLCKQSRGAHRERQCRGGVSALCSPIRRMHCVYCLMSSNWCLWMGSSADGSQGSRLQPAMPLPSQLCCAMLLTCTCQSQGPASASAAATPKYPAGLPLPLLPYHPLALCCLPGAPARGHHIPTHWVNVPQ
jgi:hypothetical protein